MKGSSVTNALQPIGQSTAIVLIVLIVGACAYLWWMSYLRSRAALIAIAMVLAALLYFAMKTPPVGA